MALRSLLEESLPESVFGNTDRFSWHATPVGIAALWTGLTAFPQAPHSIRPSKKA